MAISPITVACFDAIRATTPRNDEPETASRPFDRTRDGFVLGEGCATFVLEEYEHARRRGAHVYAEIGGHASRCNAFSMTGLRADGAEMADAITTALDRSRFNPGDVDYVNAHGSATKQNDRHETAAFNTAATVRRALALAEAVRSVGNAVPRAVVNTHAHGDHTFGNFIFADKSPIIAHAGVPGEMAAAGLHLTSLWPTVEWGDIEIVPPWITFAKRIDLRVGAIPIELHHIGPAHTRFDTIVWLPEQRVLYAGDIVLAEATPFCLMGSVVGMLTAVERLRAFDAHAIVPGHGPITGPEALDVTEAYIRMLQKVAAEGVAAGLAPLEIARETDLGEFSGLRESERLAANLHRAFAEARGAGPDTAVDVDVAFAELVDYNGGRPICKA